MTTSAGAATPASAVSSLGYLGIATSDVAGWRELGTALGFSAGESLPDGSPTLRVDERSYRLVLVDASDEGVAYVGWEVDGPAALQQVAARLTAAGFSVTAATDELLVARTLTGLVWTIDPAGNRVEFFHGRTRADSPFTPARPMAGFVTGDLGLGHIVVQAEDPAEALRFYRDVLSFRLSDHLGELLHFLRCNPRHHSIAIGNIGGAPRLLHLMVEVGSLEDVGAAFDLCVDKGWPMSMIGEHANDRMISFYVRTPSGFEIEYGWRGLVVDEAAWVATEIERPSIWGHRQMDVEHPPQLRPFHRMRR